MRCELAEGDSSGTSSYACRFSRPGARLASYRGLTSATTIYDDVPINDVFRKVDQHTVLGVMDLKGMDRPVFFLLYRE
jgi:hypothetical protein